jgi:hypothetical protein
MSITKDSKGIPIMLKDKIDLAIAVPTESGNPFHNPATGRFTFAPPGVNILQGSEIFKTLDKATRNSIFGRSKFLNANQASAQKNGDRIEIVFLRDGRFLGSFSMKDPEAEKRKKEAEKAGKEGQKAAIDSDVGRDRLISIARDKSIRGERLKDYLEQVLGREASEEEFDQAEQAIQDQNLLDLIQYLHQKLSEKYDENSLKDQVRVAVGRGYLKQEFSNLDEAQTQEVFNRLNGLGWQTDQIQETIVPQLPKRLKEAFDTSTD